MLVNRRGILTGLGAALFAAPAIVKATSLMPINSALAGDLITFEKYIELSPFYDYRRVVELSYDITYKDLSGVIRHDKSVYTFPYDIRAKEIIAVAPSIVLPPDKA